MNTKLLIVAAVRSEARALRDHVAGATVVRCGMGPRNAAEWTTQLPDHDAGAIAVAGLAGGLDPAVRAGDVVVATEVRDTYGGRMALPEGAPLVAELRSLGLRAHHGPIVTVDHLVRAYEERQELAADGALAVDMESSVIVHGARELASRPPVAVVRVIVDTASAPIARFATLSTGIRALRVLRRVGPALAAWAKASAPGKAVDELLPKEVER